jgi:glycosyltransferase involved in cell wall biosynthesis
VTEANALGTPAIAYDVPGLRDSIRHDQTGLLTQPSPDALADAMIRLWVDRGLYKRLAARAIAWSSTFSFDNMTNAFESEVAAILREARSRKHFQAHMRS